MTFLTTCATLKRTKQDSAKLTYKSAGGVFVFKSQKQDGGTLCMDPSLNKSVHRGCPAPMPKGYTLQSEQRRGGLTPCLQTEARTQQWAVLRFALEPLHFSVFLFIQGTLRVPKLPKAKRL